MRKLRLREANLQRLGSKPNRSEVQNQACLTAEPVPLTTAGHTVGN